MTNILDIKWPESFVQDLSPKTPGQEGLHGRIFQLACQRIIESVRDSISKQYGISKYEDIARLGHLLPDTLSTTVADIFTKQFEETTAQWICDFSTPFLADKRSLNGIRPRLLNIRKYIFMAWAYFHYTDSRMEEIRINSGVTINNLCRFARDTYDLEQNEINVLNRTITKVFPGDFVILMEKVISDIMAQEPAGPKAAVDTTPRPEETHLEERPVHPATDSASGEGPAQTSAVPTEVIPTIKDPQPDLCLEETIRHNHTVEEALDRFVTAFERAMTLVTTGGKKKQ